MSVTANSKGNGIVLDRGAVADAARALGLTLPVHVTWCAKPSGLRVPQGVFVGGRYTGIDPFNPRHELRITNRATTTHTSAVIWHELVHARQCEQAGSHHRFVSEYERQLREAGLSLAPQDAAWYAAYRAIPYEREAFAVQAEAASGVLIDLVYAQDGRR